MASFLPQYLIKAILVCANGALGFKLSGGGLGGITITLCKNQEIANEIAAKCQDIISNSWIEEI